MRYSKPLQKNSRVYLFFDPTQKKYILMSRKGEYEADPDAPRTRAEIFSFGWD